MLGHSDKNTDDTGLAATAQVNDLVIVTRNVANFQGRGCQILGGHNLCRLLERIKDRDGLWLF
ncbi:hypothetical protein GCM10007880_65510 [Mesorhizobium amorphae]|nr:hypothetical protein GCM10007880_65510 [Mesorhizobium amorphae]